MGGACGMSTMNYKMLDAEYINTVKNAGFDVQASIFPAPHEQRAVSDKVTIQLSDFWWHQTDDRKPVETFEKKRLSLTEGETVEWNAETPEYSAVTVDIDFEGSLEVTLCERTYTLTHGTSGKVEHFGTRLYRYDPGLSVKALGNSTVKFLKVRLYDCSAR